MTKKTNGRGLAQADLETRQRVAHAGGVSSPTKFTSGDRRASLAGQKGGQARAQAQDMKSGEVGRRGAAARWSKRK
jgi:general stress protein YciG